MVLASHVYGGEFGKGHIVGELDIAPDLWFFDCHLVADPVMPGCLGLDAMWQMVGYWLGWSGSPGRGRAVGVGEVKLSGHITPDIKFVRYVIEIHKVRRGKLVMGYCQWSGVCRSPMRLRRQRPEGRLDRARCLNVGIKAS